jgi:hypothetical protein
MTSGGNRNPANADTGGDHARARADFTDQVSLDLATPNATEPPLLMLLMMKTAMNREKTIGPEQRLDR